jgi:vacuolar-type H+-ATPase subunit I/STV1
MRQFILPSVILGLFLFGSSGVRRASESDELRARAKAMQKVAAVMAEQGKDAEAVRLKEESGKLLEAAERLELQASERGEKGIRREIDREVGYLKERLQELLAHEEKLRETKAPETELAKFRERIAQVKQELKLKEESVKLLEAAERLELRASERWEKGIRRAIDREVGHLKVKERLQDLLAHEEKLRETKAPEMELAKVGEQIAQVKRELKEIQSHLAGALDIPPEYRPQAENLAQASRRIHHLRAAAQNLKMAEEHDLALQLMEKAEGMEREVQKRKVRLAAEMQEVYGGERRLELAPALRAEFERLRKESKELHPNLDLDKR